jgi:hypothetical protein
MKAINFIEADLGRSNQSLSRLMIPSIILAFLAIGIGLGARGDFIEAFDIKNFLPATLMLVIVASLPWLYATQLISKKRKWVLFFMLSAVALIISLIQPQTPVSLHKFEMPERFWPENFHCLALGIVVSFIASLVLSVFTFLILPAPNRKWQRACSWIAGLCGLSALTFHCMGSLWSHTVIAHWGQAVLIFPFAYFQQRLLFRFQMKRILGQTQHLQNLEKIDS